MSSNPPNRKRPSNLSINPGYSNSSTRSRNTYHVQQSYGYGQQQFGSRRSASPPASAYFSVPIDNDDAPRPMPDAQSHFAYSTMLKRHNVEGPSTTDIRHAVEHEASSFWARAKGFVLGGSANRAQEDRMENGNVLGGLGKEERKDTLSARYAHCSVESSVAELRTSLENGLRSQDVPALQVKHGYNEFSVSAPEPVLLKFAKTIYESPLILLLCGSAVVSAVMGNVDDAVSITVAVLIVLTVGFIQERRSEKSLEALNKLVPHHCHVIRDGQQIHVLANELVPGDVITFQTGDRIPADVRITSSIDLEIDESSLTGETEARMKNAETCRFPDGASLNGIANSAPGMGKGEEPVSLADRSCIAYMGTLVRNGRGMGIVVATGTETEFGVIFSMMQDVEEKRTPLQLSMDELAQKLSIMSFGVIGIICLIGVLQKRSWLDMFTIGVSLAVAAIPEGLPIVTTVTLALGVLRMAKRKAIVKKLHSVEALGSVSVICSDKTGTLTKNEQTVIEVYTVDEITKCDPNSTGYSGTVSPALKKTLEVGSLCNNASLVRGEQGSFVGQSTDVALVNVLDSFGVADQRPSFTRLSERPFNSEQKYMAVSGVHTTSSSQPPTSSPEMYYMKGSIEAILDRCKFYYVSEESTPGLDATTRKLVLTRAQTTAARGLRVIGMAYGYGSVDSPGGGSRGTTTTKSSPPTRTSSPSPSLTSDNGQHASSSLDRAAERSNLVFVGFQAMMDPPRKGVSDAISLLQKGGVQVVMITGDAEETALAIAKTLGLRVGSARSHSRSESGTGVMGRLGMAGGGGNMSVLTGKAIDLMSKAQLRERVGSVGVFARTTPRHKMAIVEAFQARGAVVAMTGDGVNDAPALKMADIGVSMGKSGTDVAKEAADVILVDDNFSTILPAVEEGKSIFHNIQNFLSFQLSTAAAALTLITLSTMFGLSNPLNAMQILFINILMDGPPSQSLGVDPVDPAIMRKPPRKKDEPIITSRLMARVLFSASIIVVGTMIIYLYALSDDHMSRREQTMTFTAFVFLDLVSAVQNRGLSCALTQNRMLVATVSASFVAQLSLIYVPVMQSVFQTEALEGGDLGRLLVLAGVSFGLHECRRRYERRLSVEEGVVGVMEMA